MLVQAVQLIQETLFYIVQKDHSILFPSSAPFSTIAFGNCHILHQVHGNLLQTSIYMLLLLALTSSAPSGAPVNTRRTSTVW